jgi:hypothetical protein
MKEYFTSYCYRPNISADASTIASFLRAALAGTSAYRACRIVRMNRQLQVSTLSGKDDL